jgi:hypothetical protein
VLFNLFFTIPLLAQDAFTFGRGVHDSKIDFKLINNLMVIPVQVNGVSLSFLLDTGAGKTIVFNLKEANMFKYRSTEDVQLRGMSGRSTIKAFKSGSNWMKIGKAIHGNMEVFLVEDPELNFFPQLGIPIHGIIGKDFFDDFVVEINYFRKNIRFYKHEYYPEKRWSKYNVSALKILSGKPHFGVSVKNYDAHIELNLLLDTGMSDALWLVQDESMKKPVKKFHDFLGRSITGNVFGDRAKLATLDINSFIFNDVVSAFPDSTTTRIPNIKTAKRNGVLGGEILKRFNCAIDYKHRLFGLKKNNNFSSKFYYNVSGVELYYDGYSIFRDYKEAKAAASSEKVIFVSSIGVIYKPTVKILNVRKDSPAARIGLQKGDILLSINKNSSHNYDLAELSYLMNDFEKDKKVSLKIERLGKEIEYEFYPKDIL